MYLYMETKAEELIMNRLEGDQEDVSSTVIAY